MRKIVMCTVQNQDQCETIVWQLSNEGFLSTDVSVLQPERSSPGNHRDSAEKGTARIAVRIGTADAQRQVERIFRVVRATNICSTHREQRPVALFAA